VNLARRLLVSLALAACTSSSVGIPLAGFQEESLEAVRNRTSNRTIEGLIEAGRLLEARARLREMVAAGGESPLSLYLEARILFRERKFAESISQLERSIRLDWRNPEAHKLLASNATLLDKIDLAEASLKSALELAAHDYMARFHLGLLYYTTSRFSLAEAELRRVIELKPAFAKGYDALGLVLEELSDGDAVIQAYKRAIQVTQEQDTKDEMPYLHLGKFLQSKGRYDESLLFLRKAAELKPRSAEALYHLGKAFEKVGNQADALDALLLAIRNDPKLSEAHYLLGQIYLSLGRLEDANKQLRIFQELKHVELKKEEVKSR
jgi:tetratricopeptide (TPR) repeat protein